MILMYLLIFHLKRVEKNIRNDFKHKKKILILLT